MRRSRTVVSFDIPSWVGLVYTLLAFCLMPWTLYLSVTLPRYHISSHWTLSWIGLDIAMAVTLLLTGWLVYKRSRWVVMPATIAASFLSLDAWFDILSAQRGVPLAESVLLAAFVEIPIAIFSFHLAYRVLKKSMRQPARARR